MLVVVLEVVGAGVVVLNVVGLVEVVVVVEVKLEFLQIGRASCRERV